MLSDEGDATELSATVLKIRFCAALVPVGDVEAFDGGDGYLVFSISFELDNPTDVFVRWRREMSCFVLHRIFSSAAWRPSDPQRLRVVNPVEVDIEEGAGVGPPNDAYVYESGPSACSSRGKAARNLCALACVPCVCV
jgi:hypothetical protein